MVKTIRTKQFIIVITKSQEEAIKSLSQYPNFVGKLKLKDGTLNYIYKK